MINHNSTMRVTPGIVSLSEFTSAGTLQCFRRKSQRREHYPKINRTVVAWKTRLFDGCYIITLVCTRVLFHSSFMTWRRLTNKKFSIKKLPFIENYTNKLQTLFQLSIRLTISSWRLRVSFDRFSWK